MLDTAKKALPRGSEYTNFFVYLLIYVFYVSGYEHLISTMSSTHNYDFQL